MHVLFDANRGKEENKGIKVVRFSFLLTTVARYAMHPVMTVWHYEAGLWRKKKINVR